MKKFYLHVVVITIFYFFFNHLLIAQEDEQHYSRVRDTLVLKKIESWQNLKFGLLMHWGIYSQWGIVESWSLCAEDEEWCKRQGEYSDNYEIYKQAYRNLKKTFNPINFAPSKWAVAAKKAGMKYVIFTTKHHDGFCMFDTKTTDFKITSADCPFSSNEKANITKEIFNAFRSESLMIGAYYSKPDWNCDYYWWQYFPTPDRHVNYNPAKYPERWKNFQDYTFTQLEELMKNYGTIDILWLDGAWVRPLNNIPKAFETWAKKDNYNQDVDIPRIAKMARIYQPGLIIVDRWVNGEYENYLTPENKIPEKVINVPWESCIPIGTSWSFSPNDKYKSTRELIHLLINIVSKGGNFLLNIGVSPEGDWAPEAYDRLAEIGEWLSINGEAIYNTRPTKPYKIRNFCFTASTINNSYYAIYIVNDNDIIPVGMFLIPSIKLNNKDTLTVLGNNKPLVWKNWSDKKNFGVITSLPESFRTNALFRYAFVFKISRTKNN